jgi:uncharacterized lipoprotein YddW (UPF0748 family)
MFNAALLSMAMLTSADVPREFRGVWVATVDNIDWPSTRNLKVEDQKKELLAIVNRAQQLKMNVIVLQVRPSADALYKSSYEPWSVYLTGKPGVGPNPSWDPLEYAIELCHARGMELHAWFNPYRAWHPAAKTSPNSTHIAKTRPNSVRTYGTYLWMDPSDPFVQKRSLDVMLDVVKRYDVDGIHMDDYFYPYPVTDENKKKIDFPDAENFQAYVKSGGKLAKNDWRRKQVDDFVEKLYKGMKAIKPHVQFGISPFGIYRPGVPETIKAGIDQYDELYADCKKWLEKGWCDYMTPQLYWPIAQTPQSYPVLLKWWLSVNPKKRHIIPGNYTGQVGQAANWATQEIVDQIETTRKLGAKGNVHFSMKVFMRDSKGINSVLKEGPYSKMSIPPASPWLIKDTVPAPSNVTVPSQQPQDAFRVSFKKPSQDYRVVLAGETENGLEILLVKPANDGELVYGAFEIKTPRVNSYKLAFLDRANNLGPWVPVNFRR